MTKPTPKLTTIAESDAVASEAAKKSAATIVKRSNETVERGFGVKVAFKPNGLATLIEMYLDAARKEGARSAAEQIAELEATFDMRWDADMRAIARWRGEKPGRELTLPDHADLCVWLLEKMEAAGVQI